MEERRLYALYLRNRNVGILLIAALVSGVVVGLIYGIRTVQLLRFNEACLAAAMPYEALYFIHVLLWTMTIHKRNVGRDILNRPPVVRLVLRDGAWIFVAIIAMFAVIIPYSFLIQTAAYVVYTWPTSTLSIL
ncbi:hypothetical protein DXG01_015363, partial [Tephrocybe rancida]